MDWLIFKGNIVSPTAALYTYIKSISTILAQPPGSDTGEPDISFVSFGHSFRDNKLSVLVVATNDFSWGRSQPGRQSVFQAVKLAQIVRLAKEGGLDVKFELPI